MKPTPPPAPTEPLALRPPCRDRLPRNRRLGTRSRPTPAPPQPSKHRKGGCLADPTKARRARDRTARRAPMDAGAGQAGTGNVAVFNGTADIYSHFDATAHAEFVYACVGQVIEHEMRLLESFSAFNQRIQRIVDMPTAQVQPLRELLARNDGKLTHRARTREFAALADDEAEAAEQAYAVSFTG